MTQIFHPLFGAYIPIPPDAKFSDSTPMWAIVLYGFGCAVTLVLMYAVIQKTWRDKMRKRQSERMR